MIVKTPTVERYNAVVRAGMKRAEVLEPKLARVVRPILAESGVDASRRFRQLATDHLTASALARDPAARAVLERPLGRSLVASMALRAAAPGVTSLSTMVCLQPRRTEAETIALATGLPAEELHVTLCYLGEVEGDLSQVVGALAIPAATHAPLTGAVSGVGSFGTETPVPVVLLPSVPGLVELRTCVADALCEAGIDYSRDYGFIPHLTIEYTDDVSELPRDAVGEPLHFDELLVIRGDVVEYRLQLTGAPPLTAAGDGSPGWTPPVGDELVDVEEIVGKLRGKTDPVRQAVVETVMVESLNGVGIDFDVTNPHTAGVLEHSGQHITYIAETTRENVNRIVGASYREGLSIPATAKAIRQGMTEASVKRSVLIARTEMVGAVNGGSLAATRIVQDATGVKYEKQWLTAAGAKHPRHHRYVGLNGQTTSLDGYFDVGGYELQYPGDSDGPPREVCNCRCALGYVETEVANKTRVVPIDETGGLPVPIPPLPSFSTPTSGPASDLVREPFEGGTVTAAERLDIHARVMLDNDLYGESIANDEWATTDLDFTRSDTSEEIARGAWSGEAKSEGWAALDRLGIDEVKTLRDEDGDLLGIIAYNPLDSPTDIRRRMEVLDVSLSRGPNPAYPEDFLIDTAIRDALAKQLLNVLDPDTVLGVNHLASGAPGVGTRLMQEVAKDAAKLDKGVGLSSLPEAEGFYQRLGMVKREGTSHYYWTADQAREFAETGRVARPAVKPPPPIEPPPLPPAEKRPFEHYADSSLARAISRSRAAMKAILDRDPTLSSLTVDETAAYLAEQEKLKVFLAERDYRRANPTARVRPPVKPPAVKPAVTVAPVAPPPVAAPVSQAVDALRMDMLRDAYADRVKTRTLPAGEMENSITWNGGEVYAEVSARLARRFSDLDLSNTGDMSVRIRREMIVEVLSEVRAMGRLKTLKKDALVYETAFGSDELVAKVVSKSADWYPTDWNRKARASGPVKFTTSDRGYHMSPSGKLYAREINLTVGDRSSVVRNDPVGARVATHEVGHMMEDVVKGLKKAERAFYVRRTKDSPLELMRGGPGTGKRAEYARRDHFGNWYTGRDYGYETGTGPVRSAVGKTGTGMPRASDSFEILTMGMQAIFHGDGDIWRNDPDFRDFILGLLVSL